MERLVADGTPARAASGTLPPPDAQVDREPRARAELEARLRAAFATGKRSDERLLAVALSEHPFVTPFEAAHYRARALELGEADLGDETQLRQLRLMQAAHWVVAGDVDAVAAAVMRLRPRTDADAFALVLASGDRAAMSGSPRARELYAELAELAPADPRPRRRIAELLQAACEHGSAVADAWLEASHRAPPKSRDALVDAARAFEACPSHRGAAEALAGELERQGRFDAADEVWRTHGANHGASIEVARLRFENALRRADLASAFCAAIDVSIAEEASSAPVDDAIATLVATPEAIAELGLDPDAGRPFDAALTAAGRTRSAMARADAFAKFAARVQGTARAIALTFSAEAYASAGSAQRAVRAGRRACALTPWLPRAHSALLAAARDGLSATEVEAACACLPPSVSLFRAAGEALSREGRLIPALLAWRRAAELRPTDPDIARACLDAAVKAGDVELLRATIAASIALPTLAVAVEAPVADAIDRLAALAPAHALELVEAAGATQAYASRDVTAAMLRSAELANSPAAARTLLTLRAIATHERAERASVWLRCAELAVEEGAIGEAAYHVAGAANEGAPSERLRALVTRLTSGTAALTGVDFIDARLALATAAARVADGAAQDGDGSASKAAAALRELAAQSWTLNQDAFGSEEALFRAYLHAATRAPQAAARAYLRELHGNIGDEALRLVTARIKSQRADDGHASVAPLLSAAAELAHELGNCALALELAVDAVKSDPSSADAVELVDSAARGAGEIGVAALHAVYDALASAAQGRFGVHAAHYRCARRMESVGALEDSLAHALLAEESIPSPACARLIERLSPTRASANDDPTALPRERRSRRSPEREAPNLDEAARFRQGAVRHERDGAFVDAAMGWLRASKIALNLDEKLADMQRSCLNLISGGDLTRAQKVLSMLEAVARSDDTERLRALLEQRRAEPAAS